MPTYLPILGLHWEHNQTVSSNYGAAGHAGAKKSVGSTARRGPLYDALPAAGPDGFKEKPSVPESSVIKAIQEKAASASTESRKIVVDGDMDFCEAYYAGFWTCRRAPGAESGV